MFPGCTTILRLLPFFFVLPAGSYGAVPDTAGTGFEQIIFSRSSILSCPPANKISFDTSALSIVNAGCNLTNGSIQGIQATNAETYAWINTRTRQVIGNGLSLMNVPQGSYQLDVFNHYGCSDSTRPFRIIDIAAPVIDSSALLISPDVCNLSNGGISGLRITGNEPIIYAWFNQQGQVISHFPDPGPLPAGQYYLTLQDVYNCLAISTDFIVPAEIKTPDPPVYGRIVVLANAPAILEPSNPQPGTYYLYGTLPPLNATEQNNSGDFVTGPIGKDSTVFVKLDQGTCESSIARVDIVVLKSTGMTMPNGFSPNGDGHNDLFRVTNPDAIRQMQLDIFNRWGQKIFETTDPYQGWDGRFEGKDQAQGSYIWVLNYTDLLGNKQRLNGTVVLIR